MHEYTTALEPIMIREYGRNVQRMLDHALTLTDKAKRKLAVDTIVESIIQINPDLKKSSDYLHKIWDHLHIMSGFRLDVDAPFEAPKPEVLISKPEKPSYPTGRIKSRHYGKTVEKMIAIANKTEDPERKDRMVKYLGAYMKLAYKFYNEEKVTDDVIKLNLFEMSGGKIDAKEIIDISHAIDMQSIPNNSIQKPVKKLDSGMLRTKKRKKKR